MSDSSPEVKKQFSQGEFADLMKLIPSFVEGNLEYPALEKEAAVFFESLKRALESRWGCSVEFSPEQEAEILGLIKEQLEDMSLGPVGKHEEDMDHLWGEIQSMDETKMADIRRRLDDKRQEIMGIIDPELKKDLLLSWAELNDEFDRIHEHLEDLKAGAPAPEEASGEGDLKSRLDEVRKKLMEAAGKKEKSNGWLGKLTGKKAKSEAEYEALQVEFDRLNAELKAESLAGGKKTLEFLEEQERHSHETLRDQYKIKESSLVKGWRWLGDMNVFNLMKAQAEKKPDGFWGKRMKEFEALPQWKKVVGKGAMSALSLRFAITTSFIGVGVASDYIPGLRALSDSTAFTSVRTALIGTGAVVGDLDALGRAHIKDKGSELDVFETKEQAKDVVVKDRGGLTQIDMDAPVTGRAPVRVLKHGARFVGNKIRGFQIKSAEKRVEQKVKKQEDGEQKIKTLEGVTESEERIKIISQKIQEYRGFAMAHNIDLEKDVPFNHLLEMRRLELEKVPEDKQDQLMDLLEQLEKESFTNIVKQLSQEKKDRWKRVVRATVFGGISAANFVLSKIGAFNQAIEQAMGIEDKGSQFLGSAVAGTAVGAEAKAGVGGGTGVKVEPEPVPVVKESTALQQPATAPKIVAEHPVTAPKVSAAETASTVPPPVPEHQFELSSNDPHFVKLAVDHNLTKDESVFLKELQSKYNLKLDQSATEKILNSGLEDNSKTEVFDHLTKSDVDNPIKALSESRGTVLKMLVAQGKTDDAVRFLQDHCGNAAPRAFKVLGVADLNDTAKLKSVLEQFADTDSAGHKDASRGVYDYLKHVADRDARPMYDSTGKIPVHGVHGHPRFLDIHDGKIIGGQMKGYTGGGKTEVFEWQTTKGVPTGDDRGMIEVPATEKTTIPEGKIEWAEAPEENNVIKDIKVSDNDLNRLHEMQKAGKIEIVREMPYEGKHLVQYTKTPGQWPEHTHQGVEVPITEFYPTNSNVVVSDLMFDANSPDVKAAILQATQEPLPVQPSGAGAVLESRGGYTGTSKVAGGGGGSASSPQGGGAPKLETATPQGGGAPKVEAGTSAAKTVPETQPSASAKQSEVPVEQKSGTAKVPETVKPATTPKAETSSEIGGENFGDVTDVRFEHAKAGLQTSWQKTFAELEIDGGDKTKIWNEYQKVLDSLKFDQASYGHLPMNDVVLGEDLKSQAFNKLIPEWRMMIDPSKMGDGGFVTSDQLGVEPSSYLVFESGGQRHVQILPEGFFRTNDNGILEITHDGESWERAVRFDQDGEIFYGTLSDVVSK